MMMIGDGKEREGSKQNERKTKAKLWEAQTTVNTSR
jgi:hypothetical protein